MGFCNFGSSNQFYNNFLFDNFFMSTAKYWDIAYNNFNANSVYFEDLSNSKIINNNFSSDYD